MTYRPGARPATIQFRRIASRSFKQALFIAPFQAIKSSSSILPQQPSKKSQTSFLLKRHATSSSFFTNLFTLRSSQPFQSQTPTALRNVFLEAVESKDIVSITKAYDTIITAINRQSASSSSYPSSSSSSSVPVEEYLSPEQLLNAMHVISHLSTVGSLPFLLRIYSDLSPKFGYSETSSHQRALIIGLCFHGRIKEAIKFAKSNNKGDAEGGGVCIPWRSVLRGAVRYDLTLVHEVVEIIRKSRELRVEEYGLLLEALRRRIHNSELDVIAGRDMLNELSKEIAILGLQLDQKGEVEMVRILLALGDIDGADKIASKWGPLEDLAKERWSAILELSKTKDDRESVMDLCLAMHQAGVPAFGGAMAYLVEKKLSSPLALAHSDDIVGAVESVEEETSIEAPVNTWISLIRRINEASTDAKRSSATTFSIYEAIRSRRIPTNPKIARQLIAPLCTANPPQINRALEIYSDLISSELPLLDVKSRQTMKKIYRELVDACCRFGDGYASAEGLLQDMRSRGLSFPSDTNLGELVIRLMNTASNHTQAFRIYSIVYSLDRTAFNEKAFIAITSAFHQLSC